MTTSHSPGSTRFRPTPMKVPERAPAGPRELGVPPLDSETLSPSVQMTREMKLELKRDLT